MQRIFLRLPDARTEIRVGAGAYRSLFAHIQRAGLPGPFLVVSQAKVLAALDRRPLGPYPVETIVDGERAKSLGTVKRLIDRMLALNLTRDATLIALGGGVVGDVVGFAASVYLRGIAVVQVPTTLLAQVDSSVGGKTGVNHPLGKNLIGTFHQPRLVVADPLLLGSLPRREYQSGLYEVLKYGVIRDRNLFEYFETHVPDITARNTVLLEKLVARSLQIKADVVVADEREGGLRRILNFGHTLGHGIEAASGYRNVRHGEAVAYGMIAATRIAHRLDRISGAQCDRIEAAIHAIGKLPALKSLSTKAVLSSMGHDKKVRHGQLHFVLPRSIGRVEVRAGIPQRLVQEVIRDLIR